MPMVATIVCAIGGIGFSAARVAIYWLVLYRFEDCEPDGESARSRGRLLFADLERWRAGLRREEGR